MPNQKTKLRSKLIKMMALLLFVLIASCNNIPAKSSQEKAKAEGHDQDLKTTEDSVKDIDGNTYPILQIGSQIWMGKNLKVSKYNNGNSIVMASGLTSFNNTTEGQFVWYENDENYEKPYGKLYNHYVVQEGNLCPSGWHVPSVEDWQKLIEFLDTSKLGFNAQLGGYYCPQNIPPFSDLGKTAYWWTSTSVGRNTSAYYSLPSNSKEIIKGGAHERLFYSVRCVKN